MFLRYLNADSIVNRRRYCLYGRHDLILQIYAFDIAAVLLPLNRTMELYQIAFASRKGGIIGKTVMI
jgi:hypothetical protein